MNCIIDNWRRWESTDVDPGTSLNTLLLCERRTLLLHHLRLNKLCKAYTLYSALKASLCASLAYFSDITVFKEFSSYNLDTR